MKKFIVFILIAGVIMGVGINLIPSIKATVYSSQNGNEAVITGYDKNYIRVFYNNHYMNVVLASVKVKDYRVLKEILPIGSVVNIRNAYDKDEKGFLKVFLFNGNNFFNWEIIKKGIGYLVKDYTYGEYEEYINN